MISIWARRPFWTRTLSLGSTKSGCSPKTQTSPTGPSVETSPSSPASPRWKSSLSISKAGPMTPPSLPRLLSGFLLALLVATPAPAQEVGIAQKLYENALQLLRNGKPEEALKGFEQIYQSYGKSPQAPDALFQAATYLYPTTDLDDLGLVGREAIQKALPLLDRIRRSYETSPRAPEALYRLGLMALEPENPRASSNEAYAAFTSVANVYPDSPLVGPALFGAAVSQVRAEAFAAAVEDFSRLFEQVPDFAVGAKA
ncbi:MAG: hypothetical protein DMH00_11810, partial [Acidobacteria bacterium]